MTELREYSASQASSGQSQPAATFVRQQRPKPLQAPILVAPGVPSLTPAVANLIQGKYSYIPGTTLPVEGWFQGCRGCRRRTSYMMRNRTLQEVPACRSCADDVFRQHPDICALNLPGVCSIPSQGEPTEMNQIAMGVMSEHKAVALRRQQAAQQAAAGQCPPGASLEERVLPRSMQGASSSSRDVPVHRELPTYRPALHPGQDHPAAAAVVHVHTAAQAPVGSKVVPTAMTSVFQTAQIAAAAALNTPPPQRQEQQHAPVLPSRLSAISATQAMDCASAAPELKQHAVDPASTSAQCHSSSGHPPRRGASSRQEAIANAVLLAAAAAAAADSSHTFPAGLHLGSSPAYTACPPGMFLPPANLASSGATTSCQAEASRYPSLGANSMYPGIDASKKSPVLAMNAMPERYSQAPASSCLPQQPSLDSANTRQPSSLAPSTNQLPAGSVHVQVTRSGQAVKAPDGTPYQQQVNQPATSTKPYMSSRTSCGPHSGTKRRSLGGDSECQAWAPAVEQQAAACMTHSERPPHHVRRSGILKAGTHKLCSGAERAGVASSSAAAVACEGGAPDAAVFLAANKDLRRVKRKLSEDAAWGPLGAQPSVNSSSSVSSLAAYTAPV